MSGLSGGSRSLVWIYGVKNSSSSVALWATGCLSLGG